MREEVERLRAFNATLAPRVAAALDARSVEAVQSDIPALNAVYSVANKDEAWQILKRWLRFDASDIDWPVCPVDKFPRSIVERLQRELGVRAVETRGHVFEQLCFGGAAGASPCDARRAARLGRGGGRLQKQVPADPRSPCRRSRGGFVAAR